MDKIRIMVIDRQMLFRVGVCCILSQLGFEASHNDSAGSTVTELIEIKSPDVVLLDIDYPYLNGLKLSRNIVRHFPTTRVVMLALNPDAKEILEVIKSGAVAYLSKNTTVEGLVEMIEKTHRGEYPIIGTLLTIVTGAGRVLKQPECQVSAGDTTRTIRPHLTARHREILNHISQGKSNKAIASVLQISEQTVKNHVSSILRTLDANDRAHAIVLAIRQGLVVDEEEFSVWARLTTGASAVSERGR